MKHEGYALDIVIHSSCVALLDYHLTRTVPVKTTSNQAPS